MSMLLRSCHRAVHGVQRPREGVRSRPLVAHRASRCSGGCAKADEILHGIELSLIPKSQCTDGFKRQRRFGEHIGLEAEAERGFRFCLQFLAMPGLACINVSVLRLEIAIDTELVDPAPYLFDTAAIGV